MASCSSTRSISLTICKHLTNGLGCSSKEEKVITCAAFFFVKQLEAYSCKSGFICNSVGNKSIQCKSEMDIIMHSIVREVF